MRGTLFGIGVGPGEPEYLTIKALNCLKKSDTVILPAKPKEECYAYRIVRAVYPEIDEKEQLCMPFLMSKDKVALKESHQRIYEAIVVLLEQGKQVAFLTIGDPAVYSTYSYIHEREQARGFVPVMISGVPSFCAAAAAAGIPLGEQMEQIHIIPGSYQIADTLDLAGTKIYMKSGRQLAELKALLSSQQKEQGWQIYSISDCGLPGQRIGIGSEQIDGESGYLTIVIVKDRKG